MHDKKYGGGGGGAGNTQGAKGPGVMSGKGALWCCRNVVTDPN